LGQGRKGLCAILASSQARPEMRGRLMLETAIIGGGLCGLSLTKNLHRRGRDFALFGARRAYASDLPVWREACKPTETGTLFV
jgi:surface antigen